MNYSIEVERNSVTLAQFFSIIKKACEKKGWLIGIDRDTFENPTVSESINYNVKDGIKRYTYNGFTVQLSGEDAACKAEIYRCKPLDWQTYQLAFGGTYFNEICEFTFDDDKKGHGYYFQACKEEPND